MREVLENVKSKLCGAQKVIEWPAFEINQNETDARHTGQTQSIASCSWPWRPRNEFDDRKTGGVVMLPLLNRLNYERLLILLAVSAGGGGSMRGVRLAAMPTAATGRL